MEEMLKKLQDSIYEGDKASAEKLAQEVLASGIKPLKVLDEGMRPALARVGHDYENGTLYLPDLIGAGDAALAVGNVIEGALSAGEEIPRKGTCAIGTVKGDIHSIGKNLVSVMMKVNGFEVIDLGIDVSTERFLEVANKVDVIGLSSLLTLSMKAMEETIKQVLAKYPDLVIIIGGAAADPVLAEAFGVLYGPDAASAPIIVEETLKQRRHSS
jgi:5-methyltetrahydrofolate--homocysteine methyltransferase